MNKFLSGSPVLRDIKIKELSCNGCTICCEYISIYLEKPKTANDLDEIRWFFLHGMKIYIDKDGWFIEVPSRCQGLGPDGLCEIYQTRPDVCRLYDQKECERYLGDAGLLHFENYEDFLRYARENKELSEICRAASSKK